MKRRLFCLLALCAFVALAQPNPNVVYRSYTATIALNGSLSAAVDLNGGTPLRLEMPAAWTAAVVTFQFSHDGVTYRNLYDAAGTEYSVTVDASRAVVLSPADFAGVRYIKVRSGTAASAVVQLAARSIGIVCLH